MKSSPRRELLSRERILTVALEIVDEDGLDAISMRRVGEALGVEAMSLYHHVPNKAAILDGVFERVLRELPPEADGSAPWRARIRERATALRGVLGRHPNALPLFATRPAVTLASLAHVEAGLAILVGAGFSIEDALRAFEVLVAFVVGHTMATYAAADADAEPAYANLDPAAFPHVRRIASRLGDYDLEAEFGFGLDAFLDGLERRRRGKVTRSTARSARGRRRSPS